MCGIVGFITKEHNLESFDRRKFIEQALIVDTIRGYDGAGVFSVHHSVKKKEIHTAAWAKVLGTGYGLVSHKKFKEIFEGKTDEYKFVVGHNRSATMGGINLEATHPFQEGPITLVHNGTLDNTTRLEMSQYEAGGVNDSHTICLNLEKSTIEDVLGKLDGAFALVWHDTRDDSLRMVRNDKRPLHLAKSIYRDTVYFASEAEMLHLLDMRLNLKMGPIQSLKPMNLLTFKPGEIVPEVTEIKKVPIVYAPATFQSPAPSSYTGGWYKGEGPHYGKPSYGAMGGGGGEAAGLRMVGLKPETFKSGIKTRTLPSIMKQALWDARSLMPDKAYPFVPVEAELISWGKGYSTYTVYGHIEEGIWDQGIAAVIYGVPEHQWNNYNGQAWAMRPRGIRVLDMGDSPPVPCVIGSYINSTHPMTGRSEVIPKTKLHPFPSTKYPFQEWKPFQEPEEKESRIAGAEDDVLFPGPNGSQLTSHHWFVATSKGCCDCGSSIPAKDAFKIEWVNDRKDPLCAGCIEDRTKPAVH